jgi:hypothetical protein
MFIWKPLILGACVQAKGLRNLRHMRTGLILMLCLSACAQFPALEGSITDTARQAPYPTLQPLPTTLEAVPTADDTLDARIATLQARAARLRQIDIAALQ